MGTLKQELVTSQNIGVDKEGFLMKPEAWTEEVAEALAQEEGYDSLTEDQWKVLDYIRTYFKKFKVAPPEQMTCKETGFNVHSTAELFPTGYAQGACKIAGLPKPDPHLFGLRTNHA